MLLHGGDLECGKYYLTKLQSRNFNTKNYRFIRFSHCVSLNYCEKYCRDMTTISDRLETEFLVLL